MKFQSFLASMILGTAFFAGSAQAAIQDGSSDVDNTGGSELVLAAFDGTNTYVRDLGISFSTFNGGAPGSPVSFAADSNLQSILGNSGLVWTVLGVDAVSDGTGGDDTFGFRILATGDNISGGLANLTQPASGIDAFLDANVGSGDISDNFSSLTTDPTASNAWGGFISPSTGGVGGSGSVTGELGDSLVFSLYTEVGSAGFGFSVEDIVVQALGTWTLDSAGTLSYTLGDVNPIPVPAAVWMLGSALIGLVGIKRRK